MKITQYLTSSYFRNGFMSALTALLGIVGALALAATLITLGYPTD